MTKEQARELLESILILADGYSGVNGANHCEFATSIDVLNAEEYLHKVKTQFVIDFTRITGIKIKCKDELYPTSNDWIIE